MVIVPKRTGPRSRLDYGRAIETLRASKGLRREDVSRLARMSASYLREIELGMKRPSTDIVARIARALGMKGSAFLQYVEEASTPAADDDRPVPAVQLPLKRTRSLPLFSGEQDGIARSVAPRRRAQDEGQDRDLTLSELQVIARRLGPEDRLALLQIARHLLRRR